jgi:hypothetical protein
VVSRCVCDAMALPSKSYICEYDRMGTLNGGQFYKKYRGNYKLQC